MALDRLDLKLTSALGGHELLASFRVFYDPAARA
jgi:hypothetical protein